MVTPIHTRLSANATGARLSQARPSKRLSASLEESLFIAETLFIEETRPREAMPSISMPAGSAMPLRADVVGYRSDPWARRTASGTGHGRELRLHIGPPHWASTGD